MAFDLASRVLLGRHLVLPAGNRRWAYRTAKRAFDLAGAVLLLLLLSPVLAATWLVLFVATGGKPLFSQQRIGYCGRPFRLYKFRTMSLDAEQRQHEVSNDQSGPVFKNRHDPRITTIGRWLRVSSIDELPQLWNVLWGQMSLVGPRPPVLREVLNYTPWQLERLAVKPGLTCLWQVSGRSELAFDDWMLLDLWYVHHQSLALDWRLLWQTPHAVCSGRGAY